MKLNSQAFQEGSGHSKSTFAHLPIFDPLFPLLRPLSFCMYLPLNVRSL